MSCRVYYTYALSIATKTPAEVQSRAKKEKQGSRLVRDESRIRICSIEENSFGFMIPKHTGSFFTLASLISVPALDFSSISYTLMEERDRSLCLNMTKDGNLKQPKKGFMAIFLFISLCCNSEKPRHRLGALSFEAGISREANKSNGSYPDPLSL